MRINYFFILIICHINYLKEITIQTKLNKTKKLNRCPIKKNGCDGGREKMVESDHQ